MHLIPGRFAIALGFSPAAHLGLAWMVGEQLPSSAAPAQRALTVAMVPAAPRAVLNRIAPTARAAVIYSNCLSFINSARASRAMPVQLVMPTIAIK